ncbi:hypothetical protein [Streptomyces sp. NTH33]|uniref:hypothetical protein n=1 Tax=Streptomyces sp. NTH33 TaxID=1735453 RepID=UPI0015E8B548|nr:hypothetical protein [Streptomyces sp. NTH33]
MTRRPRAGFTHQADGVFMPVCGRHAPHGFVPLVDEENARQNGQVSTARENQLQALTDLWMKADPDHTGNNRYTLTSEISGAAFDGNGRAQGLAGDQ